MNLPIPYYDDNGTARPLGLEMSQNRAAVPAWSYAFERNPPARVIELGTAGGGFTIALALHAWHLGAAVYTYDLAVPSQRYQALGERLGVYFHQCDLWKRENDIANLIQGNGTTYVLCDGGDKPRELRTFAAYLKPGDIIAAHDYDADHERDSSIPMNERPWQWSEIRKSDGDIARVAHGLVQWRQELFDQAGWLAFRKGPA